MKTKGVVGALAFMVAAAAAGCGGQDSAATTSGLTKVRVGLVPATAVAPLYLGQDKGFFEEAGLELELVNGMGGPSAVAGVQSGSVDIAIAAPDTLVTSRTQGIELTALANAGSVPADGTGGSKVLVRADSDIDGAKDLEGKTIGVFGLKGLDDIAIMTAMDAEGADSSSVEFVNLDNSAMLGAVERGDIDAAAVAEPFQSQAVNDGELKVAFDFWPVANPEGSTLTLWFTSDEQMTEDRAMVEAFTEAMTKSSAYADAHHDELRAILPTVTQMSEEQAEATSLQVYSRELDIKDFERALERLQKYADLKGEADLDGIIFDAGTG